jgi:hypothetical protein
MRAKLLIALCQIGLLGAAGCAQQAGEPNPAFGDAVSQNAAVTIVNPQPPAAQNTNLPLSGPRGLLAITRYYQDQVVPVQTESTTSVSQ